MKKQNVRTLSLIVGTFTYLLIGAAIFDAIESEEERRHKEALDNLEAQMNLKYHISQEDFDVLEEVVQLQQPYKAGKPWKFAGSFYYATTVLTTIGYGHSTPKTDGGKIFTIIYALIGIPVGLIMFNSIGERFNYFTSLLINKIRKMVKAKQQEATELDLIFVGSTLSCIVVTLGTAAFSHYEGWTYFHSLYYCFVTLTTIGFGDYVALQQNRALESQPEYVALCIIFIMFGLAIIAALLNLMVLKLMTMNTRDEKRDEALAIKNAAHTVRLDGDIICQQNEVPIWQAAEGTGSLEDIQSVCSCTALTCDPFHIKAKSRLKRSRRDTMETEEDLQGTRCSTTMKWYSTDSLYTTAAQRSPINANNHPEISHQMSQVVMSEMAKSSKNNLVIIHKKNSVKSSSTSTQQHQNNQNNYIRSKAGSIHDLRRCAVSNLLKVPPQYTTFESTQRMPLHVQQIKTTNYKVNNHNHNITNTNPETEMVVGGQQQQKTIRNNPTDFYTGSSDEVLVIQTDTIKQDDDPDALSKRDNSNTNVVLVNGLLPGKGTLNKLAHWTQCWRQPSNKSDPDQPSDNSGVEHLPLEDLGQQNHRTQKRVSF